MYTSKSFRIFKEDLSYYINQVLTSLLNYTLTKYTCDVSRNRLYRDRNL